MVLEPQVLVAARLYPSQDAVIEDALRSLLQEKPQLRIELPSIATRRRTFRWPRRPTWRG